MRLLLPGVLMRRSLGPRRGLAAVVSGSCGSWQGEERGDRGLHAAEGRNGLAPVRRNSPCGRCWVALVRWPTASRVGGEPGLGAPGRPGGGVLKRVRLTAAIAAPGPQGRQGPDFKLSMAVGGACGGMRGWRRAKSGSETHRGGRCWRAGAPVWGAANGVEGWREGERVVEPGAGRRSCSGWGGRWGSSLSAPQHRCSAHAPRLAPGPAARAQCAILRGAGGGGVAAGERPGAAAPTCTRHVRRGGGVPRQQVLNAC